jgi:hypothetical protein
MPRVLSSAVPRALLGAVPRALMGAAVPRAVEGAETGRPLREGVGLAPSLLDESGAKAERGPRRNRAYAQHTRHTAEIVGGAKTYR